MAYHLQPGQQFTLINLDHMIFEEVWTVVAVDYPLITFSRWRRWHVDKEDILPTSTEVFAGRIVTQDTSGLVLIDAHYAGQGVGYRLKLIS